MTKRSNPVDPNTQSLRLVAVLIGFALATEAVALGITVFRWWP